MMNDDWKITSYDRMMMDVWSYAYKLWKFNDLVCVLTILLFILLINRIADVIVSANASDAEHMGFDNLNG